MHSSYIFLVLSGLVGNINLGHEISCPYRFARSFFELIVLPTNLTELAFLFAHLRAFVSS